MQNSERKADNDFQIAQRAIDAAIMAIEADLSIRLHRPFTLSKRSVKTLRYHLASAIVGNIVRERKEAQNNDQ